MKKRLEFVMSAEEYGDVTNIVGSEARNAEKMADRLLKEDVSKECIADFLYNMAIKLSMADGILRDI